MSSSASSVPREINLSSESEDRGKPIRAEKSVKAASPPDTDQAGADPTRDVSQLAPRGELLLAIGLILFMVALFVVGRIYWDDRYYVPDEGLGYWLGLVGGVMMLLAMAYGLFKHIPALRTLGWMKRWLNLHIVFGIVGPLLILVHSTFRLGSLNAAVALISVVLVFLSGVMGRFFYSKIHYGLGGHKAQLADVQLNLVASGKRIKSRRLDAFTDSVMSHPASLFGAWLDLMIFGWRSRWLTFQLRRDMTRHLKSIAKREGWSSADMRRHRKAFRRQLRAYMFILRKVALFSVYERFFAFWRHAHVPLLYLLLFSGVVHVIAVHMY